MRFDNGQLTYGLAVSVGHHFRRSMRPDYSKERHNSDCLVTGPVPGRPVVTKDGNFSKT